MQSDRKSREVALAQSIQAQSQEPVVKAMQELVELRLQAVYQRFLATPKEDLPQLQAEGQGLEALSRLLRPPKQFATPSES